VTRLRPCRRGVTALEFALVTPVLLLLMLATIEFGWLGWTISVLQESASLGARCLGVLNTSCATSGVASVTKTQQFVQSLAAGRGITLASSTITPRGSTTCGAVSGFSTVSIAYSFQTIVPNYFNAFGTGSTLSITACFPNQP
jgi:Flp pilus assembly protein TadG